MTKPQQSRVQCVRIFLDGYLAPRWYARCSRCDWWNWAIPGIQIRSLKKAARDHEQMHTDDDLITELLNSIPD